MNDVLKEKLKHIGDPYTLLEANFSTSLAMIEKNYRRLAAPHHPDRTSDPKEHDIFMKITEAKAFLSDLQLRQQYDHYLATLAENDRRLKAMGEDRRRLAEELKDREKEAETNVKQQREEKEKKRKFEEEKEKEQEERQRIKKEILKEMKPSEYYKSICSIRINWSNTPLKFNKRLLKSGFQIYGPVQEATVKHTEGVIQFKNIESADKARKEFQHPHLQVQFLIPEEKRKKLIKGMSSNRQEKVDLGLSSANLKRLTEIVNRNSNVYVSRQPPTINLEEVLRHEKML